MAAPAPRLTIAALAVAAVAFVGAGCGSDDSASSDASPATEWAGGLCSAITSWTGALTTAATSLKSDPTKDGLQSAVDDVSGATETFVDDVKGLGKPDTDTGDQAKESIDKLADNLTQNLDSIKTTVDDASGVSGLVSAATTVSTTLVTMGNEISTTFSELESLDAKGELEAAFKEASSCSALTSGS